MVRHVKDRRCKNFISFYNRSRINLSSWERDNMSQHSLFQQFFSFYLRSEQLQMRKGLGLPASVSSFQKIFSILKVSAAVLQLFYLYSFFVKLFGPQKKGNTKLKPLNNQYNISQQTTTLGTKCKTKC